MGKNTVKSPDEVVLLVCSRKNLSVQEFYDFVTFKGTQFNYDINSTGGRGGYTALHAACYTGNVALVRALLLMGALPNICSRGGDDFPLTIAFENENIEVVKVLVEFGARFDVYRDRFGTVGGAINICRNQEVRAQIRELADAQQTQSLPHAMEKGMEYSEMIRQLRAMVEASDVAGARKLFAEHFINIHDVALVSTSLMKIAIQKNCLDMVCLLAEQGEDLIEANVLYMSDVLSGIANALGKPARENDSDDENDSGSDNDNAAHSNPELARMLGYDEIAEFLEEAQRRSYQKLKDAIQLEAATVDRTNLFATSNRHTTGSEQSAPRSTLKFN